MKPARRIASLKPYYFAEIAPIIRNLQEQGIRVLRLDMGAPDGPPPEFVIETLYQEARKPHVHAYAPYGGTPEYRQAWAVYYRQRFGVDLNPTTQVLGLIGSKEGIFHLTQALVNPGEVVLIPDPGYATYHAAARIAGAEVVPMPLREERGFFPDLDAIPETVARRARLLWLNYPNNPTGAVTTLEQLARAVAFARRYNILVAHDAPYVDVALEPGVQPVSLLQVPGAIEVAVEFNSLSKRANMAGWRLGAAVGNPEALQLLLHYKSQVDSSHFRPMMAAGAVALTDPRMDAWMEQRNAQYRQRRDLLLQALPNLGLRPLKPVAGMYIWARLPQGWPSRTYALRLLQEAGVSITPGVVFGAQGEGFVRFSLGAAEEVLQEALERMHTWWERTAHSTPAHIHPEEGV